MSRHGRRARPGRPPRPHGEARSRQEERLRPLYSRVLGLRHVDPGGLLCFVFFEGSVILALLLTLAELVSWWAVLVLPASVALMVKLNDEVAAAVARAAARVPQREREAFRREMAPFVGRAAVPRRPGPAPRPAMIDSAGRATGDLSVVGASGPVARPGPTGALRALTAVPATAGPVHEETTAERPALPAVVAKPTNTHQVESPGPQPTARWPAGLDPTDSSRQRARQTARRRYE
ncbi:hypothetical protein [Micromonospora zhanjiangensis]|uniref:Uncharacterized protein n=1 Tax=Micromonospora zhanjiangensis TaxID=1522057 RepID=A0ABV8KV36_9ACTN